MKKEIEAPCIFCKKLTKDFVKTPQGELHLHRSCTDELTYYLNGEALPVVWYSLQELEEKGVPKEQLKMANSYDQVKSLSSSFESHLWEDISEAFYEAIDSTVKIVESHYLLHVPFKDLPKMKSKYLNDKNLSRIITMRLEGKTAEKIREELNLWSLSEDLTV